MRVGVAHVDVRANMSRWETDLAQLESKARRSISRIEAQFAKMNTGVNKVGTSAANASKGVDKLTGATNRQKKSLLTLLPHVAQVTAAYMAMRVAWRALVSAVVIGVEFEKKMAVVQAVSRTAGEVFDGLKDKAREMGRETVFTAVQAAEALKFLSMAGFTAAESIESLRGVLDLALIGELELGRATDIVTDTLKAMKLEASDLSRVNDVFVATITRSNTNIEMLGQAMKFAAPIASELGVSIEELSAMIGVLSQSGIKGGVAGRGLQQAFVRTAKAADNLGLKSGATLIDVLKELNERQERYEETLGKVEARTRIVADVTKSFGLIALKSILPLKSNVDQLEKFIQTLKDSEGEMGAASGIIQDTVSAEFLKLQSVIVSISEEAFEKYREGIKGVIKDTKEWTDENRSVVLTYIDMVARMVSVGKDVTQKVSLPIFFGPFLMIGEGIDLLKRQYGELAEILKLVERAHELSRDSSYIDFPVSAFGAFNVGDIKGLEDFVTALEPTGDVAIQLSAKYRLLTAELERLRDMGGQGAVAASASLVEGRLKAVTDRLKELTRVSEDFDESVREYGDPYVDMVGEVEYGSKKVGDATGIAKQLILDAFSTEPIVAAELKLREFIESIKDTRFKGYYFKDLESADAELARKFLEQRVRDYKASLRDEEKAKTSSLKKIQNEMDAFALNAIKTEDGKYAKMFAIVDEFETRALAAYHEAGKDTTEIYETVAREHERIMTEMTNNADKEAAKQIKIAETLRKKLMRNQKMAVDLYEELYQSTGLDRYLQLAIDANEQILDSEMDKWKEILETEQDAYKLREKRAKDFKDEIIGFNEEIVESEKKAASHFTQPGGVGPTDSPFGWTGETYTATVYSGMTRQEIDFWTAQAEISEQQLAVAEEAAEEAQRQAKEALEQQFDLITSLGNAVLSIDDIIFSLRSGNLAPVQSVEGMNIRLSKLFEQANQALVSGDTAMIDKAISDISSFLPKFLDFGSAFYGSDYAPIFESVIAMLEDLKQAALTESISELGSVTDSTKASIEELTAVLGPLGIDGGLIDITKQSIGSFADAIGADTGSLKAILDNMVVSEGPVDSAMSSIQAMAESLNVGPESLASALNSMAGADGSIALTSSSIGDLASALGVGESSLKSVLSGMYGVSSPIDLTTTSLGTLATMLESTVPGEAAKAENAVGVLAKALGIDPDSLAKTLAYLVQEGGPVQNMTEGIESAFESLVANVASLGVQFKGANWEEFVGGLTPEPVFVSWQKGAKISDNLWQWWVINPFTDHTFSLERKTRPDPQLFYPQAAEGGLYDGPTIGGEAGPEWFVPTKNPYSSKFLKDVGADPVVIGNTIASRLGTVMSQSYGGGSGEYPDGSGEIHVHLHVDGAEIGSVVADQAPKNPDMMESLRRNF